MEFTLFGALSGIALLAMLVGTYAAGYGRGVRYGSFIRFCILCIPLVFLCSRVICGLASGSSMTQLLQPAAGGFSMTGAILGVILAAIVTEKWQRLTPGSLLDAAALSMPVGIIIVRLAQPLCDFGWGYQYESAHFAFLDELDILLNEDVLGLHPVFIYEALATLAVFGLIALLRNLPRFRSGDLLLSFLLLYGCTQTVMESLLNSGHMKVIHFVKINQVAAMVMAVIPLIIWSVRLAKARPGSALRIGSAWALTVVCILSGVVQEFSVEGQDNPYFSVVLVGAAMAALLAAATLLWCIAWRKEGLRRLLPVAVVSLIAIAAAIVDRTIDVGDSYRIVLWGIMACDMLLLCLTGFALRRAADNNEQ